MKVAITGSTGLLGEALLGALERRGDEPLPVRRRAGEGLQWTIEGGFDPPDALSGFDAVVHLAGENLADGRWNEARKKEILDSRVLGTRSVVRALERAHPRPKVLLGASAIGYYGDCGDTLVDEDSTPGSDFLAQVCVAWEQEANHARDLGVRTVLARTSPVLAHDGGALAKLLPIFRLGLGGRLGSGKQWFPWIHIDDWVAIALRALDDDTMAGPYNFTAPEPVTNAELTKALGRALHRPTFMPVPGPLLRLGVGEMADTLLGGQRALPKRLRDAGFEFRYPRIEDALSDLV
jgi:uncharacterized protein (TIGR01777 family)